MTGKTGKEGGRWITLPDYPDYEINGDGRVRCRSTGKVLRPVHDAKGREIVVFHQEKGAVCEYLADLMSVWN